ncbi:MAG: hypothetical protein F4X21_05930 [Acidimicrobiia bacterium]|nr:hypothetical protein [Acidimicrobiia bacterium]
MSLWRITKIHYPSILLVAALALVAMTMPTLPGQATTGSEAEYKVTFKGSWTADKIKASSLPAGAHFTTLAGAVHGSSVTFWRSGGKATDGVAWIAELGITTTFASEVDDAIEAGTACSYTSLGINGLTGSDSTNITLTDDCPLVTYLTMIAPTSDQFLGISSVSLRSGSSWLSKKEIDLYPYDAGTKTNSAWNLGGTNTDPQANISSIRNKEKYLNLPLATLVFDLVSTTTTSTSSTSATTSTSSTSSTSSTTSTIIPSNQLPSFSSSFTSRSVAENTPSGRNIGTAVTASDPDGDALTYRIGGTGANHFSLHTATGQLQTKSPLDYETQTTYSVTITADDQNGGTDTITVTIKVTDVNESDGGGGGGTSITPTPRSNPAPRSTPTPAPQPVVTPPSVPDFTDVSPTRTHYSSIRSLQELGFLTGTECGPQRFCPGDPISRSTMAVWLVRLLDGVETGPTDGSRFMDVDDSIWWAPYVERLAELEVTLGCDAEGTMFCPEDPVNRAQMASFLARALNLEPVAIPTLFEDVPTESTHADNIQAILSIGITRGCSTDSVLNFCPDRLTTRAQMAGFVDRARTHLEASGDSP